MNGTRTSKCMNGTRTSTCIHRVCTCYCMSKWLPYMLLHVKMVTVHVCACVHGPLQQLYIHVILYYVTMTIAIRYAQYNLNTRKRII